LVVMSVLLTVKGGYPSAKALLAAQRSKWAVLQALPSGVACMLDMACRWDMG